MNKQEIENASPALIAGILYGLSYPAIIWSLESFSVYEISLWRSIIGMISLGIIFRFNKTLILKKKDIIQIGILSLFGVSMFWILLNLAVEYSSPNEVSLIMATYPLFASIIAWGFLKERLTKNTIIGLTFGIIGAGFIFGLTLFEANNSRHLYGLLGGLGACVTWSSYVILTRMFTTRKRMNPNYITFNSFLLAIPILLLISIFSPKPEIQTITNSSIIGLIWLGIFSSSIAFLLTVKALKKNATAKVSSYLMVCPFVTVIASFIFLDQIPVLEQIIGGLLIVVGVIIANR